jgi:hypothetical protein
MIIPPYTHGKWQLEEDVDGCKDIVATHVDGDVPFFSLDSRNSYSHGDTIGYTHGMGCEKEDKGNAALICQAPNMAEFIRSKAVAGDKDCLEFLKYAFPDCSGCDECEFRFKCYTDKDMARTQRRIM